MEALQEFIKKRGKKATKPKRKSTTLMIDVDLPDTLQVAQIELRAQEKRTDLSVSDIVNDAINFYLSVRGIKKI